MESKKSSTMNPAPDRASDKSSARTAATSSSASSAVNSSPSARSQPAKSVDESMKELASLFFQIKRAESSQKPLTEQQQQRAQELVADLKAAEVKFFGIISKCWISGNDCHMLNSELEIMKHFSKSEPVPTEFEKARSLVPGLPPQVVALMVYSHQIQYLYVDGTVQTAETNHA